MKISQMTAEQREAKMREIGLVLPRRKMAEFQKKMNAMAKANFKVLMEKAEAKFSKNDANLLRKMGLSPEQIANADPNENPFTDKGLGQVAEIGGAMSSTQELYEELKAVFKRQEGQMSLESEDMPKKTLTKEELHQALSILENPDGWANMSRRKQLEFERRRLVKLRSFFDHERDIAERQPMRPSFIRRFPAGQLDLFWDMLERMIQSKNHAIYEAIQNEKKDRIDGVAVIEIEKEESEAEDPLAAMQE